MIHFVCLISKHVLPRFHAKKESYIIHCKLNETINFFTITLFMATENVLYYEGDK